MEANISGIGVVERTATLSIVNTEDGGSIGQWVRPHDRDSLLLDVCLVMGLSRTFAVGVGWTDSAILRSDASRDSEMLITTATYSPINGVQIGLDWSGGSMGPDELYDCGVRPTTSRVLITGYVSGAISSPLFPTSLHRGALVAQLNFEVIFPIAHCVLNFTLNDSCRTISLSPLNGQ